MANKEGTEPRPNITSYIENKQNSLAAYWGGKTSQWPITVLGDLGAVGEMASVALYSSYLAICSTRKWHTFLLPSNKINPNPSCYSFCAIMSTISILITPLEIAWNWFMVLISLHMGLQKQQTPSLKWNVLLMADSVSQCFSIIASYRSQNALSDMVKCLENMCFCRRIGRIIDDK